MAADPEKLRFYVDESALGLGKALAAARQDTVHVGHPLVPECPLSIEDHLWIPAVAKRDLIVIARDKHIRTRPGEVEPFREAGLRVFWIAGKRDESTWQWLHRIVRMWDQIEEAVAHNGSGPWFCAINQNSLASLQV